MARVDVLTSSANQNWITPDEVFTPLNREFNFCIDLAATSESKKAPFYFGPDHVDPGLRDALALRWSDEARRRLPLCNKPFAWLNPPYGRSVGDWVAKSYEESRTYLGIVMLIYARTETIWFHKYVAKASEVRFLKSRVKFVDPITRLQAMAGATAGHMAVVFRPFEEGPPRFVFGLK